MEIGAELRLPSAGIGNTFPYQFGLKSDIDFAVDEFGKSTPGQCIHPGAHTCVGRHIDCLRIVYLYLTVLYPYIFS